MNITETCIRKPVFAWMIMLATIVFGAVAGARIGISQFPDVDFPTINIGVTWEGAAPESVESDVVEPIEEAVMQVEGVKSVTSSSRQGGGSITVELNLERDVDLALQDVTAKVSQVQRRGSSWRTWSSRRSSTRSFIPSRSSPSSRFPWRARRSRSG